MQVQWSAFGLDQADLAAAYVAQFNVTAALDLYERFTEGALLLSDRPYIGRTGRVPGTREYVAHPNYIMIYTVHTDRIIIDNIVHSRPEYP
ncbi:type II toxin-antitoxin system RelE/ParE family toxin [Devosia aurantiaca]|uniref:Type II toxin-antitoxin system RelE/ParE family toxin n=1 Tax=Devosia aurantiaca TaxID=2714858 RepID=A0A6M1SHR9_9HYPH|nr:type II toxin-antitoxin system RelE/ParE family toxin [Devosia aurantiaca]NGP19359.1 type II toxin-antitoxin system RelE/ParE family toxin [Devosia aurantiaca]